MSKFPKFLVGFACGLVFLLLLFYFFADPLAELYLQRSLEKASGGAYVLKIGDVDIKLLEGDIALKDLSLSPKRDKLGEANLPALWLDGAALQVKGVQFLDFIFRDVVVVDSLVIRNTNIRWESTGQAKPKQQLDFNEWLRKLDIYNSIRNDIARFELNSLLLDNVNLEQVSASQPKNSKLRIKGLMLWVDDVVIDASTFLNNDRFMYAKGIRFKADTISRQQGDKITSLTLNNMSLALDHHTLSASISKFKGDVSAADQPALQLLIDSVQLSNFDTYAVLRNNKLKITYLKLLQPEIRGVMAASDDRVESNLSLSLRHLNLLPLLAPELEQISIDSISISRGKLSIGDLRLSNLQLLAKEILLDSMPAFAEKRFLHAKSLSWKFDSLSQQSQQQSLFIDTVDFEFEQGVGNLFAKGFQLKTPSIRLHLPELNMRKLVLQQAQGSLQLAALVVPRSSLLSSAAEKGQKSMGMPDAAAVQQLLKPYLASLSIESIQMPSNQLQVNSVNKKLLQADWLLEMQHLVVDERPAFAEGRFWYATEAKLQLNNLLYTPAEGKDEFGLKNFTLDSKQHAISLHQFYHHPLPKGEEWYRVPYETAYFVEVPQAIATGIRWDNFFLHNFLELDQLIIHGLDFRAFKNIKLHENRKRPMPQDMLQANGFDYLLHKLDVKNSRLIYRELADKADTAGLLYFTRLSLQSERVTDRLSLLRKEPDLLLRAEASILDQAPVFTDFTVHMLAADRAVTMEGGVGSMEISTFNSIAKFNSPIMLKEGELIEANWKIKANETTAVGEMQFYYKDLGVRVNTGDKSDTTGIVQGLASGIANLIIKNERLAEDHWQEPQPIEAERDPNKSFFNFYWRSILSGIKNSIGVP